MVLIIFIWKQIRKLLKFVFEKSSFVNWIRIWSKPAMKQWHQTLRNRWSRLRIWWKSRFDQLFKLLSDFFLGWCKFQSSVLFFGVPRQNALKSPVTKQKKLEAVGPLGWPLALYNFRCLITAHFSLPAWLVLLTEVLDQCHVTVTTLVNHNIRGVEVGQDFVVVMIELESLCNLQ